MNKKIFRIIALILILAGSIFFVLPPANAEISVRGFNAVTGQNQTTNTYYITLDDTSQSNVAKQDYSNISLSVFVAINYSVANKSILSCFFTSQQIKNNYDVQGNFLNSTIEIQTSEYNYSAIFLRKYYMLEKDVITATLDCIWNDSVDDTLFQYLSTSVVGMSASITNTYACELCVMGNEPVSAEYIDMQKISTNYLQPFYKASILVNAVMIFITVLYWVLMIFGLLLLVSLTFALIIWFYDFVKTLGRQ